MAFSRAKMEEKGIPTLALSKDITVRSSMTKFLISLMCSPGGSREMEISEKAIWVGNLFLTW
jgi:hypothetical protein